jgi:DNA polymerase-3 subunit gamma/tau
LWQCIDDLSQYTPNYAEVLRDLATCLHTVAVAQLVPEAMTGERALDPVTSNLKDQVSPEDVQLYYQIAVQGRRDIDLAPDHRLGFEMAMLRMLAFQPGGSEHSPSSVPGKGQESQKPSGTVSSQQSSAQNAYEQRAAPAPGVADRSDQDAGPSAGDDDWEGLISRLGLKGTAAVLASNSVLNRKDDGQFALVLNPEQEHLKTAAAEERIRAALVRFYGKDVSVKFELGDPGQRSPAEQQIVAADQRQQSAEESIDKDPVVADMKSRFGATVIANSVKPVQDH